jgi:hypothetical protein
VKALRILRKLPRALVAAGLGAWAIALIGMSPRAAGLRQSGPSATPPVPVVVELFTSEGCSSCPPADTFLIDLATKVSVPGVRVITLSEHVDYWDHDGWRDPFSSAAFTARQTAYADRGGDGNVYTPEMIVDGETAFIGSDRAAARTAIIKAASKPKAPVVLAWTSTASPAASIDIAPNPATRRASIVMAITEDGLHSSVSRGENAGRTIAHTSVTRRLGVVGQTSGDGSFHLELPVKIDPAWNRHALRVVVFAQLSGHQITAAGAIDAPDAAGK